MEKESMNRNIKKETNKIKKKNVNKKKKRGFTLIELLAVIVILGLLMAIAIPSVTRYITQSRRKTVVSSIDGYISSVVNAVNDQDYKFTEPNTIYAVPIECVPLEKGGNNPFGEWSPVSDNYWAYVLVQYNSEDFSYTYGFTFKDSSGYGMYPTSQNKLNPKSSSQIKTGLNLTKPTSGLYTKFAQEDNWIGFDIDEDTKLVVLESNTCAIAKPCTGEGEEVGDVITCDSEKFYVIESTASNLTLLTELPINPDVNSPVQNASASTYYFSNASYWLTQTGPSTYFLKPEYDDGSTYPYVYDSNADIYKYVNAYEKYLINLGVIGAKAKLISYNQLVNLGCPEVGGSCSGSLYKNYIATDYNWISGSIITSGAGLWGINGNNVIMSSFTKNNSIKIRPVVTIPKSEVKIN